MSISFRHHLRVCFLKEDETYVERVENEHDDVDDNDDDDDDDDSGDDEVDDHVNDNDDDDDDYDDDDDVDGDEGGEVNLPEIIKSTSIQQLLKVRNSSLCNLASVGVLAVVVKQTCPFASGIISVYVFCKKIKQI